MTEYADKLVSGIPYLPADIEVLREANGDLAQENFDAKCENDKLKKELKDLKRDLSHYFKKAIDSEKQIEELKIESQGLKENLGYCARRASMLENQIALWKGFSDEDMRLRCGEMSAQEIRTVRAVLNAIA